MTEDLAVPAYAAADLVDFAKALFKAAGLDEDKAATVGRLLVEADLMGHTTHGLALAAPYLQDLEDGRMAKAGEPDVLGDRGAAVTWDGRRLPGAWLTAKALDLALERAAMHGLAGVAIRRSHHIGCLAVYLLEAAERNCMAVIASSDPSEASVAPFNGLQAVFTPDPIAIGIPTGGDPILIDISASITTNGMSARLHREGRRLPGPWVMDAAGCATDDPSVLFASPPGTILPIGGREYGHKGYGLALMIEALTQALSGYGRADAPRDWGASVFVQVIDPAAFGGIAAFTRQTGFIVEACRRNPPTPGIASVRLPGQGALEQKRRALAQGVSLYPGIMASLEPWSERLGVTKPAPIAGRDATPS